MFLDANFKNEKMIPLEVLKEKMIHGAGYISYSTFTKEQREAWIKNIKKKAELNKYTPEQRYLTFVVKEFIRFARAVNAQAFVEADKCFDIYFHDIVDSNLISILPNEGMKKSVEESLVTVIYTYQIMAQIFDEELEALDKLYYEAFPTDIVLPEIQALDPEEMSSLTEPVSDKKVNTEDLIELLKTLKKLTEKTEKSKPATRQDVALDFLKSDVKTRKKDKPF